MSWSWGQMDGSMFMKLLWKFHPTSGTLSRLHFYFKSLPRDFKDVVEMVSDARDYPSESFVKVSRNNLRNPSKTSPFLNVCSWSLGGHGGSWWTWRWCLMIGIILLKLLWKFHKDPASGTPPVLQVSPWSLGGCGGSWWSLMWCQIIRKSFKSFCFIKILHQKHQNS